jgi:DNA invertase Pin-like site-specific DNA recombinase
MIEAPNETLKEINMPHSALVGYARTSTTDQKAGLEAQLRDLEVAGCTKIFDEELSSVVTKRPQLEAALDYLREGDTLIVTKIDRLARSVSDLVKLTEKLKLKGVHLRFLANPEMDTESANGKLMLTVLGAIAEFERDLMLERQREGIARAKAEGKYKGRKPTARAKSVEVVKMKAEGVTPMVIASQLEISRASVFRILKDSKQQSH